jgi:hypothetical protein
MTLFQRQGRKVVGVGEAMVEFAPSATACTGAALPATR